jgi:hypothetical protein
MKSKSQPRVHLDQLHFVLERELPHHFGRRCRIQKLRRRRSPYSSSYPIENLKVDLDGGQQLHLVLKDLSPASMLETARQVRPHFLYNPLREIETYRSILQPHRLGTAICYGAIEAQALGRYWLFLERVPGPLLWQTGRIESIKQAARWLAMLHTEFNPSRRSRSQARFDYLLTYDQQFYSVWPDRAEESLRRKNGAVPSDARRGFGRLTNRYDQVIRQLLALPTTFIHGEFYPSNVVLRTTEGAGQICPIDWELAALAPGLIDVAALTAGHWTDEEKRTMVAAYREALEPTKAWPPSLQDLMEAVECCQLHLCVQLLGWASNWSPPERHTQNWLREALRLAGKMGL